MGHEHGDYPAALEHVDHGLPGLGTQAGVQGTERFVEQDHLRLLRERSGERDPLLLSARELVWHTVGKDRVECGEFHHFADACILTRRTRHSERDVAGDREVREQGTVLRDVADAAPVRGHRRTWAGELPAV